jgi:Sap, sulfolipid-1-addressing protein
MPAIGQTLIALAPFVAVGAFLPTWTLYVVILLGTRRPLANGLAFVAGNATFRLALGAAALASISLPRFELGGGGSSSEQAIRAGLLGAVFLALALAQWRQRRSAGAGTRKVLDLLQRTPPWLSFVLGFAFCAAPGAQWLYQLGALGIIQDLDVRLTTQLAWLVAIVFALELMLLTPLVLYVVMREHADTVLARLRVWLENNSARAAAYVLGTLGALLMLRAAWLVLS